MTINDREVAAALLRGVTITLEARMMPNDVENVWELIDAGEWGLAFDILCTQLYEYDVRIDQQTYDDLAQLGQYYEIRPSMWEVLRPAQRGS